MKNVEDYIVKFNLPNYIKNNLLLEINKCQKWDNHSYTDANLNVSNYDKEFDVVNVNNIIKKDDYNNLMQILWEYLHLYCKKIEKTLKKDEFLFWNGYSIPRINKYNKNTVMREHWDSIHSLFDGERKGVPTYTILGLLQNADKGGELVMWDNENIDMDSGDVIIFPSTYIYKHKVNEILEGTRISFVSWAW